VLCDSRMYNTLLEIAIQDPTKRDLNRELWAGLSALNGEFLQPMQNAQNEVERRAKSRTMQDKAVHFVERFTDVCGMEVATLYCHHAMDHIPDQVRDAEVDISDLSQQSVEHSLKASKEDMRNFSNKRLRDETNDKGRNYQVLAKERERVHLKREVAMSRNERKMLGDGTKEVKQAVDRARRKGLLDSRSATQLDKALQKGQAKREQLVAKVLEERELTLSANLTQTSDNPVEAADAEAEVPAEVPTVEVPAGIGSADLTAGRQGCWEGS
jgi:hypothetical protein